MPITPCFDPATGASGGAAGGGGAAAAVTPPSPTSESKAAGAALTNKTFSAFTDPAGVIASFTAVTTTATGSASWSGSGLGAYTPSSSDGDSGTLSLNALAAGGQVLATAVHTYDRASPAGASWVVTSDTDLTALPSTTLSAGSQVISGVTLVCDGAGETVGGGAGLTAGAADASYQDVSAFFSGENPRLVELKIVNAAWGGTGTGNAVRGRFFADTAGSGPAAQTRYYPSGSNMRFQAQWQPRYVGVTGGFSTSGGSFDHTGDSAELTWYSYIAMVRGTFYVWISKTVDVPTSLVDLLTPDAFTWVVGVNAYSALGTTAYQPATALAGIFNQSGSSLGLIENVRTLEFK